MRSPGFTLCAALAVTVLTPGPVFAAAARAPGGAAGTVAVTPSAVAPGTDTVLQVTGCPGRTGHATSEAFVDAVPLARVAAGLVGDARVRSTADPGAYTVSVRCDGEGARATGAFEVVPAPARAAGDEDVSGQAADSAAAGEDGGDLAVAPLAAQTSGASAEPPATPSAPVRAGGGGMAAHPAAGHRAVPPAKESRAALVRTAAAGHDGDGVYAVGLVLAGGAALALTGQVLRMRRRRKGSDDGDAG